TLTWTASDNAAWLTVSPASGTGNGAVTLTATNGTLGAGTYSATVTITAPGAVTRTVPVTFTLASTAPPAIGTSPASLSFAATVGWANPAPQTLSISNTGSGTLSWTASDNAAWLTVSPASGTGNGAVTLTVTNGTLSPGIYSATVTITAPGAATRTVPVTFALR
ncbi:MAG: BACON domain-containing carbohydrate-binding protein, partial [Nitrospirota bacterium]|nr:BACON domain-containing carbohydrate-binding protein [Nitrospirota bacterium]